MTSSPPSQVTKLFLENKVFTTHTVCPAVGPLKTTGTLSVPQSHQFYSRKNAYVQPSEVDSTFHHPVLYLCKESSPCALPPHPPRHLSITCGNLLFILGSKSIGTSGKINKHFNFENTASFVCFRTVGGIFDVGGSKPPDRFRSEKVRREGTIMLYQV